MAELRPLLALQAVAGSLFGLALFLVPVQFAELAGFTGANVFMMRLAGAATLGYAVGAAVGLRAGLPALRILLAATATFNAGAVLAAVVAIARGEAEPIVLATGGPVQASLILATATLVSVGMAVALRTEGR